MNAKDLKRIDSRFGVLHEDCVLRWRPWVGERYEKGGLMVVAETNYANSDCGATPMKAIDAVNGNWHFTRNVVELFCVRRDKSNRTFDAITNLLKASASDKVQDVSSAVWQSFAYMDVIQKAMRGTGWQGAQSRERHTEDLWKPGWMAVFEVIKALKPGKLLFVGAGLAYHCTSMFLPTGVSARLVNKRKVGRQWLRTGEIVVDGLGTMPVVSIPNPGSARGFAYAPWRNELKTLRD